MCQREGQRMIERKKERAEGGGGRSAAEQMRVRENERKREGERVTEQMRGREQERVGK